MKEFDIIILGAGAAGCFCSLKASESGMKILLIDKSSAAGKKLMVTGNGRCNLTNVNIFPSKNFYNQNIDKFLELLPPTMTINLFEKMGLLCYSDEEGRVYPISNSARSVIDVLNNQIKQKNNISLELETNIVKIETKNGKYLIRTDKEDFLCKKLIYALGGNSFNDLFNFKLNSKPFLPSLVALKTNSTKVAEGQRLSPVEIKIFEEGKIKFSEQGEILFKDNGISGIVAFNASTYFARKGCFNGEISIDFLPQFSFEKLISLLKNRKMLKLSINKMFAGIFTSQIGYLILNNCQINENRTTLELSEEEIENLAKTIKSFKLNIKGNYPNNQVYSGGITLTDLTEKLESKVYKNLYFCGETCDVDGKCGGYNLQWAWTSGYIVGEALC